MNTDSDQQTGPSGSGSPSRDRYGRLGLLALLMLLVAVASATIAALRHG